MTVKEDRRTSFWNQEQVDNLHGNTENQLDPEVPPVAKESLGKGPNDGSEDASTDGREDDEGNGVLLIVGFPQVGDHTQGDRPSRSGQTAKSTSCEKSAEVGCETSEELPYVDKEQAGLEYRLATEFLRPGCPEFAPEGVSDQEDGGTQTGSLRTDAEFGLDVVKVV